MSTLRIGKPWTAVEKLSTVWKSDLSVKIKRILQSCIHISTIVGMNHLNFNETPRCELHNDAEYCWEQIKQLCKKKL